MNNDGHVSFRNFFYFNIMCHNVTHGQLF